MIAAMPLAQGARVLVVDDDPKLVALVVQGLVESDLVAEGARDIDAARALLRDQRFDIVLLDVMLGTTDGRNLLTEMRAAGDDVAVILVTARDATDDRIEGLRLGADDYVVKPFAFAELLARIQAVLRRRHGRIAFGYGELSIEPARRRAMCCGRELELSPREFDLLSTFVRARGRVLSRTELLADVWGMQHDPGTNVVDVIVGRVRRKLKAAGGPELVTVRGEGYRLEEPR
jgi:two-component system copper resistance phosphate regulon response regulator CusR